MMMEPPTAADLVTVIAVRPVLLPSAVMVKSAPRLNSAMMATPMLAAVAMRIVRELAPVQPAGMDLFVPNSKPATMETKPIAMVATILVTGSITFAATVFSNAPKSVTTATPRMMEMAAAPPAPEREVVVTALSNLCSKPVMMAIPTHAVAAMLIVPVLAQAPPVVTANIVPRLNFATTVVPIAVGTATPIVREPVWRRFAAMVRCVLHRSSAMTATRTIAVAATLTARRLAVDRHAAMEMFVLNLKLATTSTPMIATGASRIVHAETMCGDSIVECTEVVTTGRDALKR